ncbi:GNAT family N-acetyltransferase [Ottowia thiooxydans]|uniref:RimJ/RimL family protein N-acetyltransferase n=1 Tax=Ottowia thiooxydans TaxID=219182 RepID=A0ABV2Q9H2_9BURK
MHRELTTPRLLLRQWSESDFEPFSALNADEEVMKYFTSPLSLQESHQMAERCQSLIAERGWGLWAAEEKNSGLFIGFIGLHIPAAALPFSPCIEVGWRLAKEHWGEGLATEGARACLQFAFDELKAPEVVSFTSIHNHRSEAVMQRLGMARDKETFFHPAIEKDHRLSEHCLYRIQSIFARHTSLV